MGNDGGSIPTRRELVKEVARTPTTAQLKETQQEQQIYAWTHDPITRKPLSAPVVSDVTGRLYNKETILELLVSGEAEKATAGAVTSLKDVVELKLVDDGEKGWKCPVTGAKLGPGAKAVYVVPCGHVFSGVAIKEVAGERCVTCDGEYAANDVIPILPLTETDAARLVLRRQTLREKGLAHSLKKIVGEKSKKRKNRAVSPGKAADGQASEASAPKEVATATAKTTQQKANDNSRINNTATASLTAKVMHEQEASKKRRVDNANVASLFSNRDGEAHHGKSADFMTRGYSVPAAGGKK